MLLAEFSMWPMDKGESVGTYVARLVDLIDRSGLPYRLGPLGTCVEGEYDQVMALIKQCHQVLAADCNRVYCTIKMDYRKGHPNMLESKIASVENALGRKVRT
jgi:uncharacterized protein (TIGR00106 family)